MQASELFRERPETWGLRGDPYLWEDMLTTLEEAPMPATSGELSELIGRTFRQLTGVELASAQDRFHLERYEGPG